MRERNSRVSGSMIWNSSQSEGEDVVEALIQQQQAPTRAARNVSTMWTLRSAKGQSAHR
jgi:hypothetical protein